MLVEIMIKFSLANKDCELDNIKETKGFLNDKVIKYNDGNVITEIILDSPVTLKRVNNDYDIELTFVENKITNGSYFIKDIDRKLDLKITTKRLVIKDGQILIDYVLDINDEEFKFRLDYEVMK